MSVAIVIGGSVYLMSSTSAATFVVAGMISLVNSFRISAGNPPLGWINPAIYQYV